MDIVQNCDSKTRKHLLFRIQTLDKTHKPRDSEIYRLYLKMFQLRNLYFCLYFYVWWEHFPVRFHGRDTWSLKLKEIRLKAFAYRVLGRIFGSKRDKMVGML
jgi:hypothetical protein